MVGMGVGNSSLVYTVLTLSLNQDCDFVFDNLMPHRGSSETQLHHLKNSSTGRTLPGLSPLHAFQQPRINCLPQLSIHPPLRFPLLTHTMKRS